MENVCVHHSTIFTFSKVNNPNRKHCRIYTFKDYGQNNSVHNPQKLIYIIYICIYVEPDCLVATYIFIYIRKANFVVADCRNPATSQATRSIGKINSLPSTFEKHTNTRNHTHTLTHTPTLILTVRFCSIFSNLS